MNQCCWCGRAIRQQFVISDVFSFSSLLPDTKCEPCSEKLVTIEKEKACPGCSRNQDSRIWCQDCLKWKQLYPDMDFTHTALYEYEGLIPEWLEAYKYKGDYRLAAFFQKEFRHWFSSINGSQVILPIPVSETSLHLRGFNQVEGLLQAAAVPFLPALTHKGSGKKQSEKNRIERLSSKQPFCVKEEYREQLKGKKILIVDDVYTTGRTLFHAREAIKAIEAAQIDTFTLAR